MTNVRLLYRLEWLALALLALVVTIVRVDWSAPANVWLAIIFLALPDLSLLTFGAGRRGAAWPYAFYNVLHSLVVWAAAVALVFALNLGWQAALLAWFVHISLDRALGFALRRADGTIAGPAAP
ncbi:MAG: DUF4260 family protein [Candidatus Promineifilaceae bacterium]